MPVYRAALRVFGPSLESYDPMHHHHPDQEASQIECHLCKASTSAACLSKDAASLRMISAVRCLDDALPPASLEGASRVF